MKPPGEYDGFGLVATSLLSVLFVSLCAASAARRLAPTVVLAEVTIDNMKGGIP
jgi:hypothetical protein